MPQLRRRDKRPFRFMDLPAELRARVHDFYFARTEGEYKWSPRVYQMILRDSGSYIHRQRRIWGLSKDPVVTSAARISIGTSIVRVCRQLRQEATPMLFCNVVFALTAYLWPKVSIDAICNKSTLLPVRPYCFIQNLELHVQLFHYPTNYYKEADAFKDNEEWRPLRDSPYLKRLVVYFRSPAAISLELDMLTQGQTVPYCLEGITLVARRVIERVARDIPAPTKMICNTNTLLRPLHSLIRDTLMECRASKGVPPHFTTLMMDEYLLVPDLLDMNWPSLDRASDSTQ